MLDVVIVPADSRAVCVRRESARARADRNEVVLLFMFQMTADAFGGRVRSAAECLRRSSAFGDRVCSVVECVRCVIAAII